MQTIATALLLVGLLSLNACGVSEASDPAPIPQPATGVIETCYQGGCTTRPLCERSSEPGASLGCDTDTVATVTCGDVPFAFDADGCTSLGDLDSDGRAAVWCCK